MPTCTKAEREYLDELRQSQTGKQVFYADGSALGAMLKEWGMEPPAIPTSKLPDFLASAPPRLTGCPDVAIRLFITEQRARHAESALAEERAKPKEGARRFSVNHHLLNRDEWVCNEKRLVWSEAFMVGGFVGPDAERHAREHAARLQAEHDAKGGAV